MEDLQEDFGENQDTEFDSDKELTREREKMPERSEFCINRFSKAHYPKERENELLL